jgi:hypothetical protein
VNLNLRRQRFQRHQRPRRQQQETAERRHGAPRTPVTSSSVASATPGQHGLEPIDDGLWNILYYNTLLGRLSERTGKISGASFRSDEC